MSLLDALTRGWYRGVSAWPDYVGGGIGLIEDLIPGKQDFLEEQEQTLKGAAERIRQQGPEGESTGLLEKIAEGLGAAPLDLTTYLPAGAVAKGLKLGKTIAAPAFTFGVTSAIRSGGEGLGESIGQGLRGAAEGAAFGAIGKYTGGAIATPEARKLAMEQRLLRQSGDEAGAAALQPQVDSLLNTLGQQIGRKGLHAAGAAGVVGGAAALEGQPIEDVAASAGTMGILGLLGSGRYEQRAPTMREKLEYIAPEAEKNYQRLIQSNALDVDVAKQPTPESTGSNVLWKEISRKEFSGGEQSLEVVGIFPTKELSKYPGAQGEVRGEHRNRSGKEWGVFVDSVKKDGVLKPITVNVYPGKTVISEGNHRIDAAIEAGVQSVPAIVKYWERAERHHPEYLDKMERFHPLEEGLAGKAREAAPQAGQPVGGSGVPGMSLEQAGQQSRALPEMTKAGQDFYIEMGGKERADKLGTPEDIRTKRTSEDVRHRAAYELILDENGNPRGTWSNFDAVVDYVESNVKNHSETLNRLEVERAKATQSGNTEMADYLTDQINKEDAILFGSMGKAKGAEATASSALRTVGTARKGESDWVRAVRELNKRGIMEKDGSLEPRLQQIVRWSQGNPELMAKITRAIDTPKLWDYFQEYWINGLLSGIPTQAVNITSNAAFQGLDIVEHRAALLGERGLGKVSKDVAKYEMMGDIKGRKMGLKVGIDLLKQAMKDEGFQQPENIGGMGKMETRGQVIPGMAGKVIRYPGRFLYSFDLLFKAIGGYGWGLSKAYRKAAEMAERKEIDWRDVETKAKELMDVGDADVLAAMKESSARTTFTTPPDEILKKILSAREVEIAGTKPLMTVIPFANTPWNIIKEVTKRSPLGILRLKSLKNKYDKGEITPAEFSREIASTAIGSLVTATFMGMAHEGFITGGGPVNVQDKQNLIDTGWRPYSLKLGDVYVPLQRIEPFGSLLGMAADVVEVGDAEDKTGKILSAVKDNLTNKTFLVGLENIATAWANPEMSGQTYLKQQLGSLVPTILAKGAQAVDPYGRQTSLTGTTAGVPDAMAYRLPFVSQELERRSTPFGEPRERWSAGGLPGTPGKILDIGQSFVGVAPISLEREGKDVEREFNRLRGYEGMPPAMPKRSKKMTLRGVGGQNVELTEDEYKIYDRYHAQAKQQIDRVIKSSGYQRIPENKQAELIGSIYDKFRRAANNEINVSIRRRTTVGN